MEFEYLPKEEKLKCYPANSKEKRGIKSYLTRYRDGYFFDPLYKLNLWNGKDTKYDNKNDTISLGLWQEAIYCCKEFGYPFKIKNPKDFPLNREIKKKDFYSFLDDFFKDYKYQPRYYQKESAWEILKNRYGNISIATGGGKTFIYSLIIFYLLHKYPEKKFLLVVPSITLVVQFYDDIMDYNQNKMDLRISEIYAENENPRQVDNPNLVISTYQSLTYTEKVSDPRYKPRTKANGTKTKQKYKTIVKSNYPASWYKQFWGITVDESHKSSSESYSKKILKYTQKNAYYRFGMSGSYPKRDSHKMMMIMDKTGPVLYKKTARELINEGYLTDVKIRCIHLKHNDYKFQETLEIVSNRDKKAMYDLEQEYVQKRTERLDIISNIVKECKENTLVLFHNKDYGEKLLEHLSKNNPDKEFHYIDGSVKQKRTRNNEGLNRDDIKSEMIKEKDKVQILVASFGTLSTGISIATITNIIFTQSFKAPQRIIQSIGRALRLHSNKKCAYIFDIVDIFNVDEYAYRTKKKFKNKLSEHGNERKHIYDDEEHPYKIINLSLPEILND